MPSSATITAFYSFSANTRARASQVQANFDNFRGHLLPIEPLTITSSDITYDLGSDEHRWRTAYIKTLNLDGVTSTSGATIETEQSITSLGPAVVFKINGSEVARLGSGGRRYASDTSGSVSATATGYSLIPNQTVNITCSGTRPVELGFLAANPTVTLGSSIFLAINTAAANLVLKLEVYRGATLIHNQAFTSNNFYDDHFSVRDFYAYDNSAPAGVNTYTVKSNMSVTGAAATLYYAIVRGVKMYAEEKIQS